MSSEFKLKPVNDNPANDAKLLGHDTIVRTLKNFIESNDMISSSSIAIHGDWGTGKTSIMTTLSNQLDGDKIEVLFFEAWKYEYSNPSLSLISEISGKYHGDDKELAKRIVEAAIYILTDKFLGVDPGGAARILRGNTQRISAITDDLKKIISSIGKRLVIIIDDLDRCDVENSLQILSLMKLFLSIDNCVIIAAVDFKRLQQAWRMKYQISNSEEHDSRDYLDKIFQIRIGIPVPSKEKILEYVLTLTENMPDDLKEIFSTLLPKNPRTIKRMLNLISYRSYLLTSTHGIFTSCLWTSLEQEIGNELLIRLYDGVRERTTLANMIFKGNFEDAKNHLNAVFPKPLLDRIDMDMFKTYIERGGQLVQKSEIILRDFENDFESLYLNTNEQIK